MSHQVWKFLLTPGRKSQQVSMPRGATVLHCAEQRGAVALWAMAAPDAPREARFFSVYCTGEDLGPGEQYVGTAMVGPFVLHVFEVR